MKKLLLFFTFILFFCCFGSLSAQQSYYNNYYSNNQKSDDGVLVAYPNPAKDFIYLKSKDTSLKIKSVTFYSILGNQVAQYNLNIYSGEINIDRLKPGKYLMKYVMSDDTEKVTQVIKQ